MTPLKVGEEFTFELDVGKTLIIQLNAVGRLNEETGKRDVFFLLNGESRVVSVEDVRKDDEKREEPQGIPEQRAIPRTSLKCVPQWLDCWLSLR